MHAKVPSFMEWQCCSQRRVGIRSATCDKVFDIFGQNVIIIIIKRHFLRLLCPKNINENVGLETDFATF